MTLLRRILVLGLLLLALVPAGGRAGSPCDEGGDDCGAAYVCVGPDGPYVSDEPCATDGPRPHDGRLDEALALT